MVLSFKVPLEEQLDTDQLESLKKYQERKQQKQSYTYAQVNISGSHRTQVSFFVFWSHLPLSAATGNGSSHGGDL